MNEDEEHQEDEPIEEVCQSCGEIGEISNMIDCPRLAEDLGKHGIAPGLIHTYCCEEDFLIDPSGCIESCDNEELFENIETHSEECIDTKGLTKTELKGVPVFLSADRILGLTTHMNEFLESFKPLNVVVNVFQDIEDELVYVKDNQKNVNSYSLSHFKKLEDRLTSFSRFDREEFCVKDGPLFLVYRYGAVSLGALLAPRTGIDTSVNLGVEVATKYKRMSQDAERFFGVVLQPHKEELKSVIQRLSEDELIDIVLCPLLSSLGFKGVKPISFHGPQESGADLRPFYKTNEFGKIIYYSAQAKAAKIHAKSGAKEGNVNQLIHQIKELFRTPFKSFIDNTEKRISYAFVFTSYDITPSARNQLFYAIENHQNVSFVDIDDLITLIIENKDLAEQILRYCERKQKTPKT